MHDAGAPTLSILTPIEVDVPWDELDSSASGLKTNSSDVEASMSDVGTTWGGLQAAYKQPASQETVWSAMDEVPGVVQDWADTMDSAGNIIQDFVTEGRPLQETAESLRTQAWILEGRLAISRIDIFGLISDDETDEDSQLRQDIDQHNQDVLNFNSDWRSLESRISGRLEALHGASGRNLEIPRVYADGTARPNVPGGGFADSFDLGQLALAADSSSNPNVQEAEELHEAAMAEGATGEDQQNFLEHLGEMSPEEINEFAENNEEANLYNLPAPSSEADLETWPDGAFGVAWWNGMSREQRDAMSDNLPLITGNVEGVPVNRRHQANLDALDILRESGYHDEYDENLEEIERATVPLDPEEDPEGRGGSRWLLSLDVGTPGEDRQPFAEVSIGNPDHMDETTYSVPGMESGTHGMEGEVDHAQNIYSDTEGQAVVAMMGYEPPTMEETIPESLQDDFLNSDGSLSDDFWSSIVDPELLGEIDLSEAFSQEGSVLSDQRAEQGGYRFAHALDSRQEAAEARGRDHDVNIVAHSYGSNMTSHALTQTDIPVQSVTFMGSSGIPEDVASSADDLNVEYTEDGEPAVYATEAAQDHVAMVGRGWVHVPAWASPGPFAMEVQVFPPDAFDSPRLDPTDEEFGAIEFDSSHHNPFYAGEDVTGHSRDESGEGEYGYLDPDSMAYWNIINNILEGEVH